MSEEEKLYYTREEIQRLINEEVERRLEIERQKLRQNNQKPKKKKKKSFMKMFLYIQRLMEERDKRTIQNLSSILQLQQQQNVNAMIEMAHKIAEGIVQKDKSNIKEIKELINDTLMPLFTGLMYAFNPQIANMNIPVATTGSSGFSMFSQTSQSSQEKEEPVELVFEK